MARAYQCDRCMQYYTANKDVVPVGMSTEAVATGMIITTTVEAKKKQYELCDNCLKELTDWLAFRTIARN